MVYLNIYDPIMILRMTTGQFKEIIETDDEDDEEYEENVLYNEPPSKHKTVRR